MGREVIRAVVDSPLARLAAATEQAGHRLLGNDAGALAGGGEVGIKVSAEAEKMFAVSDAVIDFSAPAAMARHAALAAASGAALVVGVTGADEAQLRAVRKASDKACVVMAANMSAGVTLLLALTSMAAARLGDYDVEILEMHHRAKKDSPSGTALALGQAAALARGLTPSASLTAPRSGARRRGEIGLASLRGGDVAGEHHVLLAGDGEVVTLSHRAGGRSVYARGALRAALWAKGRAAGLYAMTDVLGDAAAANKAPH